jgi:hypothetical protein
MLLNRWIRPWLVAVASLVGGASSLAHAQTGAALSYLRAVDATHCEWVRQPIPSGKPTAIPFEGACGQSTYSWNRRGTEGLVFYVPVGGGTQPRLWRVDFAANVAKPVDLKGLPVGPGAQGLHLPGIDVVGFDAQGAVVAIITDIYQDRKPEKDAQGQFLLFEGKRYPLPPPESSEDEGWPGLAFAYRLEAEGWKRIEAKGTLFHAADAPGWNILDTARALVTQSYPISDISPDERVAPGVAKKLDAAVKKVAPGKWMYLPTPSGILYYRAMRDADDDSFPSTPIRWDKGGKLVELAGLGATPGDRLAFQLQDGMFLIQMSGKTHTPHTAEVFDANSKQKLTSVKGVYSPRLWPLPVKP